MNKKETAVNEYLKEVIYKSWTWERLTEDEKDRFNSMYVFNSIKGTFRQRIEWLNTIYTAFLIALEYKPIGWRETENELPQF